MKSNVPLLLLIPLALALAACGQTPAPPSVSRAVEPASVSVRLRELALPTTVVAGQPDLVADDTGGLLLSWVEPQGAGHALRFAMLANGRWSAPRTIARGADWFVNWADTPHLAVTADGALWAHWLQKSAQDSYAYDVAMTRSGDGGQTWSTPVRVNDDGKAAEHGFVSMWPAANDALGVAWLDGRDAAGQDDAHAAHGEHDDGHGGAMTLRAATFDARLQRRDETRLDAMTCDCCQTDAAITARGPLLAFRDRTPDEIRDIAVSRLDRGAWSTPHVVHADDWKMPACPVNGPALAARGHDVVVAWYTAAGDVPAVKLAHSSDDGDRFAAPVTLDRGESVQGRVDVAVSADAVWVAWLREDAGGQSLQLAVYAPDLSRERQRLEVARLQGRGRGTGFPQLAVRDGGAVVVWSDVIDGKPHLRAAAIAP
jgi:hypothetical protein